MLHPSYTDLMRVINSDVEIGEELVVNSRYSIVIATAKRARQLIAGSDPLINSNEKKAFSIAVDELYKGKVTILTDDGEEGTFDENPEEDRDGNVEGADRLEPEEETYLADEDMCEFDDEKTIETHLVEDFMIDVEESMDVVEEVEGY